MRPSRAPDLGERFGRWTVTGPPQWAVGAQRRMAAPCRCDCGAERVVLVQSLRRKDRAQPSCGCWRRERTATIVGETRWANSHGLTGHPLYQAWKGMMSRCYNPADFRYRRWGGRGIKVHEPWHDVREFVAWAEGNLGPKPGGSSIDRWPDNDGHYEPGNVRWADARRQYENATHLGRDPATGRWVALPSQWRRARP